MITVTISRRPLESGTVASNVLEHGSGAVNIDATRVSGVPTSYPERRSAHAALPGDSRGRSSQGMFAQEASDDLPGPNTGGRWPANLILGHKAGCVRLGTKRVESTSGIMAEHHRRNVPMGQNGIYGHGDLRGAKPTCYVSPDGTEVVESWECADGCPVLALDEQSGILAKQGSPKKLDTGDKSFLGTVPGAEDSTFYGDTGGASRYFKQIGAQMNTTSADIPADLLDYLHTLITPTHVGGKTLVALDIGAVDWAAIPDGSFHGVIARGEPTEEQVEHMWRVVRPGAHVLLIAPDERPTGHRGACALENRGFEIRDAILWVREAGRLHYVPKANTRERNAGCEALAVKRKGPPIYELTDEALADEEQIGSIMEALQAAGVADDMISALTENGLPQNLVPDELKRSFKKQVGGGKYGNNHPCVKPREVMAKLLGDVSIDAVVLDPFMGSGSTALACLDTKHNFIGIEREADYIAIADARVRYWERAKVGWVDTVIESEAPEAPGVVAVDEGGVFDMFD